jgi:sec-independent protein translocase protein TatA
MGDVGLPEILIIVVIVLLLFGPGKIAKIAGELGTGIRSFREGIKEEEKSDGSSSKEKGDSEAR